MHGSINFPAGGFEGHIDPNIRFGDAGSGFGLGGEFTKALKPNLGWTSGAHLLLNALERGRDLPPRESEMGSWVNVPLLTGLRVSRRDANFAGYFQFQGGMNFGSVTESTFGRLKFNVDWATSPALGLGVGMMVKQFHIGVRYYNIFESGHDLTLSDGTLSDKVKMENVAPGIVQLLFGVAFGG